MNELTTPTEPAGALAVGAMMQTMIEKGVTADNVAALEKITDLYIRMQDRDAERQFNRAFLKLQGAMKSVIARKAVPDKQGHTKYTYAPFEDIMEQVQPRLLEHGFGISFDTSFSEGRMYVTCKLKHEGGHSETNRFGVRIGNGPPGSSEAQADGAAKTYAKRAALCDALNIVVEQDNDARALGDDITPAQAMDLQRRAKAANVDEHKFLKFAQSPVKEDAWQADIDAAYLKIPSGVYDEVDAMLKKKESQKV